MIRRIFTLLGCAGAASAALVGVGCETDTFSPSDGGVDGAVDSSAIDVAEGGLPDARADGGYCETLNGTIDGSVFYCNDFDKTGQVVSPFGWTFELATGGADAGVPPAALDTKAVSTPYSIKLVRRDAVGRYLQLVPASSSAPNVLAFSFKVASTDIPLGAGTGTTLANAYWPAPDAGLPDLAVYVQVIDGQIKLVVYSGSTTLALLGTTAWNNTAWHQVTVVNRPEGSSLFVDGTMTATTDGGARPPTTPKLAIGPVGNSKDGVASIYFDDVSIVER